MTNEQKDKLLYMLGLAELSYQEMVEYCDEEEEKNLKIRETQIIEYVEELINENNSNDK